MQHAHHKISFDFDQWQQLARTNPAAFEIKRHETISQYLEQLSPEQKNRLEKLQWRIDMEIKRSANPLSALLKIYDMMMTSLHKQQVVVASLLGGEPALERSNQPVPKKTVIPLKQRSQS